MTKRISRVTCLLFALILLTSLLTACGTETGGAASTVGTSADKTRSARSGFAVGVESGQEIPGDSTGGTQGTGGQKGTGTAGGTTASTVRLTQPQVTSPPPPPIEQVNLGGRKITIFKHAFNQSQAGKTETGKRLIKRAEDIGKKLNCSIEFAPASLTYESIKAAINSGLPNVDILDGGGPHFLSTWVGGGNMVVQLDKLNVFNFADSRFEKSVIEATTYKGAHYAVYPKLQGMEKLQYYNMLVYNKKLTRGHDIPALVKNKEWTWDKFKAICAEINNPKAGIYAVGGSDQGTKDEYFYAGLVESNGAKLISNTSGGYRFTADSPAAVEAFNFYRDMKDYIKTDGNVSTFTSGKLGFVYTYVERLLRNFPNMVDEYGVTFMPRGPQADDYYAYTNWYNYYMIPTGVTKAQDVAIVLNEFCKPLFTDAEDARITQMEIEGITKNAESRDALLGLTAKSRNHPMYDCGPLMVGEDGWNVKGWLSYYVPHVYGGGDTIDNACKTVKNSYAEKIKAMWK